MKKVTGLKLLLHSHSMNQSQLAEQLEVSPSLVSNWATGKVKMTKEIQDKIMDVVKNRNNVSNVVVEEVEQVELQAKNIKTPKTLEGRIKSCKKYCLENFGFEVVVVNLKKGE